jgi:hypothetical protein
MHFGFWLGAAVVLAVLAFQIFVTVRVWKSAGFERPQKVNQSRLIWLLPMLGSVIVFSVLTDEDRHVREETAARSHHQT